MRARLVGVAVVALGVSSVAVVAGCNRGSEKGSTSRSSAPSASPSADVGMTTYREAEGQYRALVLEGVSPRDPRFDGVKAKLREVPEGSKAHADAQGLLRRLEAPFALPERPLATPSLADDEAPCEPLAQALGKATEAAERERILTALRDCRAKEEKRKAHDNHPPGADEGHGAGHEGHAH